MASTMPAINGVAAPAPAPHLVMEQEPRRLDKDGHPYTQHEFFEYYGSHDAWNAAPVYHPPQDSSTAAQAKSDSLPSVGSQQSATTTKPAKMFVQKSSFRSFDIPIEGDNGEEIHLEPISSSATPASQQNQHEVQRSHSQRKKQGDHHSGSHHKGKHHHHHHHHHKHHHKHHHNQNPHAGNAASGATARPAVDLSSKPAPRPQPVSPTHGDDHAEAKRAFDKFDVDNDGCLDQVEVGKALRELGIQISDRELDIIFGEYDVDGNGTLDLPEFTLMMGRQRCNADSKDSLRQAFAKCDTDGSGTLEIAELRQIMKEFGVEMDDEELDEIFREADVDGSGAICYDEFVEIMGTGD